MEGLKKLGLFGREQQKKDASYAIDAFYALHDSYKAKVTSLQTESGINESVLDLIQTPGGFTPLEVAYKRRRAIEDRTESQPDVTERDSWFVISEDGNGLLYSIHEFGQTTPEPAIPDSQEFVGYDNVTSLIEDESKKPYPGVIFLSMDFNEHTLHFDDIVPFITSLQKTDQTQSEKLSLLSQQALLLEQTRDEFDSTEAVRFQNRLQTVLDKISSFLPLKERIGDFPYIAVSNNKLLIDRKTAEIRLLPEGNEELPSAYQYTKNYFKEFVEPLQGRDYIEAAELAVSSFSDGIRRNKGIRF